MLYWFNKAVWWLVNAETLLLLALALGGLLAWLGAGFWRRLGRGLLAAGILFALAVALLPLDRWVLAPLESRFPPPAALPARIEGAVVLGGGISVGASARSGRAELNKAGDRILAMIALAVRYPEARILYASGVRAEPSGPSEAALAARLAEAAGLPPGRILLEQASRNTRENAVSAFALADPQPGERWLLVTSASHMPRAVASFRAAGWAIEAWPVDFEAAERPFAGTAFAHRLRRLNVGLKEWLGLAGYRLLGWTDTLFPAPRPAEAGAAPRQAAPRAPRDSGPRDRGGDS